MSDEMMSCDGDSSSLTIVVCVTRPSVTLTMGPRGSVGVTPGQVAALECVEVRGDMVTRGVVGGG